MKDRQKEGRICLYSWYASKKDKIYANGFPYLGIYKSKVDPHLETFGPAEAFSKNILNCF